MSQQSQPEGGGTSDQPPSTPPGRPVLVASQTPLLLVPHVAALLVTVGSVPV